MYTNFPDIDTPSLLIEENILLENIKRMAERCKKNNISLRPHIKTHKIPELAKLQLLYGAKGIAVAKISEAEVMAEHNFGDILIANIIVGSLKLEKLFILNENISKLAVCIDSEASLKALEARFKGASRPLGIFIKINSGFDRAGISNLSLIKSLARSANAAEGLTLRGILSHAGQVYGMNRDDIQNTTIEEIYLMILIKKELLKDINKDIEISLGSTPASKYLADAAEIDELRVGNYIYNDMIQVSLGSAQISECAQSILATIISVPASNRAIIDAGSKVLSLDKGGHGQNNIAGHGHIINKNATITRLSEEHGIIEFNDEIFTVGEKIRIIPNHACAVSNLFDYAYLVNNHTVKTIYRIAARGKST